MTDEELENKAEEIMYEYLKCCRFFFSDMADEDAALDLIKIALVEGRKELEKENDKLKLQLESCW